MPIFIQIKVKDRYRLFKNVKRNINSSWNKFYPSLKISRSMFFNYLSGRYNLPQDIFLKMQKIAGIKIDDYRVINSDRYVKKDIPEPKMSVKLAEIIGALNGDGHVSKFKYEICIVLDSREKDYRDYLKKLCEEVFGTPFTLFIEPGKVKIRTYSIDISNMLIKKYGLPKGNKIGKLKIPEMILKTEELLVPYIRGLFDTDGSFYIRRKKDPVIEITSADPKFLIEVKNALISLNFHVAKGVNRIFIYKKEDINKFFSVIKPANTKHLKKHQNYLNLISASGLMA